MGFVWAIAVLLFGAIPAHEGRPWTDTSGNFHVVADLADVQNGRVYLKESNGRTVPVPLAKLSLGDRELVAKFYPAPNVIDGHFILSDDVLGFVRRWHGERMALAPNV